MSDGLRRRDFLKVVGVGSAGAAVAGCSEGDVERLIPYVVPPEEITPGVATWYATTCGECAAGCGVRVRTREGRAVMMEGNPDHPVSQGGLCSRGVSALQGLYNPDRLAGPMRRNGSGDLEAIGWEEALALLAQQLDGANPLLFTGGKGPAEGTLLNDFAARLGGRRVIYDVLDDAPLREAVNIAFGVNTLPRYEIAAADLLVSFGADFLETWLTPVRFTRDFARMHAFDHGEKGRFVFVGPRLSLTGQNADEWIPARPGSQTAIALALAGELVRRGADAGPYTDAVSRYTLDAAAGAAGVEAAALSSLADRFAEGSALALGPGLAGWDEGATAANLAVLILNVAAGSLGRTLHIPGEAGTEATSYAEIADAVAGMRSGTHRAAVVAGTNPAYSLPGAFGFAEAFATVPFKVAFATALDETAHMADLVLPDAHPLESWGDSSHPGGVYAVRQPVMRPVPAFDSRPMGDVLLDLGRRLGEDLGAESFRDFVRARFAQRAAEPGSFSFTRDDGAGETVSDPDSAWRRLLRSGSGHFAGSVEDIQALQEAPGTAVGFDSPVAAEDGELSLIVHPSPRFGDGTHSNRPWLQELPDPVSKVMWHGWAEINPTTAERLGLREGDVVAISTGDEAVEVPVWVYPGIHPGAVALAMGGGHSDYGRYANGNGVNPVPLLGSAADAHSGAPALIAGGLSIAPTGAWRRLASTEGSSDQDDRNITPAVALSAVGHEAVAEAGHGEGGHGQLRELQEGGGFRTVTTEGRAEDFPLPGSDFGAYGEEHPRWAMALDLDKCTGCGACVTACQAENNIPWVGEDQVAIGREMHWLRLERYYETVDASHSGPVDIRFLPMLCQHCNNAPCEPVCPVFAAYHTPDGLNAQAYNRCVGTRYCANNCPYKVRVFNWLRYTDEEQIPAPLNWQFNPDVTVRENGVMEKCTFCVQRIREAGNRAALEGREVRDGEVVTACQSVCPAGVITFGNIKDHDSQVAAAAGDERAYRVLDALINTQPAVHYLRKVTLHDVEEGGH